MLLKFAFCFFFVNFLSGSYGGNCPFTGQQACTKWEYDVKIGKLEASVGSLVKKVGDLEDENIKIKSELSITRALLSQSLANKDRWQLKRIEMTLPKMTKLKLHNSKPTVIEKFPLPFPKNTKAIIVSLYCNFWNGNGHAYLGGTIQQKGNSADGPTKFFHQHYNVYANTWREEYFIPWNNDGLNKLELKVTSSYISGGGNNWFTFAVVGYVIA